VADRDPPRPGLARCRARDRVRRCINQSKPGSRRMRLTRRSSNTDFRGDNSEGRSDATGQRGSRQTCRPRRTCAASRALPARMTRSWRDPGYRCTGTECVGPWSDSDRPRRGCPPDIRRHQSALAGRQLALAGPVCSAARADSGAGSVIHFPVSVSSAELIFRSRISSRVPGSS
jgi:hypothetical protein